MLAALSAQCPVMARLHAERGLPPLRRRPAGFEGLVHVVVFQQISTLAAQAIWRRTQEVMRAITPERFATASDEDYRASGQSRPKVRTLRAVAAAVLDGTLDLESLPQVERRGRPRRAGPGERHRSLDRRRLSPHLPRPWRRLAGRRHCAAGRGAGCPRPPRPAGCEGDDRHRRALAAASRRRGAAAVGTLRGAQGARRRAGDDRVTGRVFGLHKTDTIPIVSVSA